MSKHMKRLAAPRSWVIPRKTNVYTTKPRPGAHPVERALPLATVVRDFLKLTETGREARRVIGAGDILVDGRVVKDAKFAVGFQDVVSVPKTKQAWRVMVDEKARLRLVPIPAQQAAWKLSQIASKTTIKGGATQLNLHDGRNLLVKKDDYATGDVLRLELPGQKILGHFPLKEGAAVFVVDGRHAGEVAPVKTIEATRSNKDNLVHLARGAETFTTIKPYAFPIGDKANLPTPEDKSVLSSSPARRPGAEGAPRAPSPEVKSIV
ncbi:MAG: small subunit ribosomal protein S4e [Thermoplasmata archaeon]|jgi:small subunit ribosomal protein S4e|nr:small subunit ribosomal protein S4e [Thermoplasmata archaeon]